MTHSVLILGAASDIGQAIALELSRQGAHLHLAGRSPLALQAQYGSQIEAASYWEFDALAFHTHGAFFDQLVPKPTIVVCAVGFLGNQEAAQFDFDVTQKIIDSNFTGPVSILNIAANYFEQQNSGQIIGISSVAGDRGRQSNYLYGASKAGFTQYLSGLRGRLFKSNVHVMTVKPGFVATKMTAGMALPPRLTATPAQVAVAVVKASQRRQDVVYVLPIWRVIMTVVMLIPERVFKRLRF